MEIKNYQNQLFSVIDRSYLLDGVSGLPVEKGVMPLNYTKKVEQGSYGKSPYERYNQLDNITHIGTFGKSNSQASKLPEPIINCNTRYNETSSRFNYAFDKCIDRKLVDVSGQQIPNNMLRIIPNRGVPLCYQKRYIMANKEIQDLSNRIGNISSTQLDKSFRISTGDLTFKASKQRLSKEELQGLDKLQITKGTSVNDTIQTLLNKSLNDMYDNKELLFDFEPQPTPQIKKQKGRRDSSLSAAGTSAAVTPAPSTIKKPKGRPKKKT